MSSKDNNGIWTRLWSSGEGSEAGSKWMSDDLHIAPLRESARAAHIRFCAHNRLKPDTAPCRFGAKADIGMKEAARDAAPHAPTEKEPSSSPL
jgi:hypothetical protein